MSIALPFEDDVTTGAEALARMRRLRALRRMPAELQRPGDRRKVAQPASIIDWPLPYKEIEVRPAEVRHEEIMRRCCELWDISYGEMIGDQRPVQYSVPRMVAMALCCRLTMLSSPQIGKIFRRDHTTVLHAKWKYWPLIESIQGRVRHELRVKDWCECAFSEIYRGA